jgi:hypothetical protein
MICQEVAYRQKGFAAGWNARKPGRRPIIVGHTTTERHPVVTKRIRLLVAGISLAAAAVTGTTLTTTSGAQPPDTTWGAPADDSDCCLPPANPGDGEDGQDTPVRPADTTWG